MSKNVIIDLALDLAKGSLSTYSKDEANAKLREALNKLTGSEDGSFSHRKFRKNKDEIFEIIEEVVDARVEEGLRDQFDPYVDYRSTAFGDKLSFTPESDELFEVAKIAGGTNNLRRQRIAEGQPYQIDTDWYGVAIYEELERFLSGKVDWVKLIDRVEASFKAKITEQIFNAVKAHTMDLQPLIKKVVVSILRHLTHSLSMSVLKLEWSLWLLVHVWQFKSCSSIRF